MRTYRRLLGIALGVMWLLSNGIAASAQEVTKTMRWDIVSTKFEVTGPTTTPDRYLYQTRRHNHNRDARRYDQRPC